MIRADADARFVYDLAAFLKKSVGEVLDFSVAEVRGWHAYLRILEDEKKKARRPAR
ncbi:MAG: hypothetical protein AAF192_18100 [Pseudomonadota bacterium]